MSLLDGRDTVQLFCLVGGRDEYGMPVHSYTAPIRVFCSPQWQTPQDNPGLGLAPHTRVRVIAREWVGRAQSVFWWQGATFTQVGEPKRLNGSRRTAHCEVEADLVAVKELDPRTSPITGGGE